MAEIGLCQPKARAANSNLKIPQLPKKTPLQTADPLSFPTQAQIDQPAPLAAIPTEGDAVYRKEAEEKQWGCFGVGGGWEGLIQVVITCAHKITNEHQRSGKVKLNKDANH